jgi:hypothetical protein
MTNNGNPARPLQTLAVHVKTVHRFETITGKG